MAIDTRVQPRMLPFWTGFVGATVITLSWVVVNVLHRTSQTWGRFGGPYTYGYWLLPSLLLVALFVVLALVALAVPYWRRFGVGLVIGTLTGAALSLMFTMVYFKYQTDSYLINRPECGSRNMTGPKESCHGRDS